MKISIFFLRGAPQVLAVGSLGFGGTPLKQGDIEK
jgi:hypothetical protein